MSQSKKATNPVLSVFSIGLIWAASVGLGPAQAPASAESSLEFIPVVIRASNSADYGTAAVQLTISPMQFSVIASTLADRGADAEQVEQITSDIEAQIEQNSTEDGNSSDGSNETGSSLGDPTPLETRESNSDTIPGEGNAYGLSNGNNGNQGQGNSGDGNGNNGGLPPSSNGLGLGLQINAGNDEIEIEVEAPGNSGNAPGQESNNGKQGQGNNGNGNGNN